MLKFFPFEQPAMEGADEIKALLGKDLSAKLAFAKSQQETASVFLLNLVKYLRQLLLQKFKQPASVEYSFGQLKEAIEQAERHRLLCSLTNVNQRLALEALMIGPLNL